jgi:hypothetical protein
MGPISVEKSDKFSYQLMATYGLAEIFVWSRMLLLVAVS